MFSDWNTTIYVFLHKYTIHNKKKSECVCLKDEKKKHMNAAYFKSTLRFPFSVECLRGRKFPKKKKQMVFLSSSFIPTGDTSKTFIIGKANVVARLKLRMMKTSHRKKWILISKVFEMVREKCC